jgi:hypothetical protein
MVGAFDHGDVPLAKDFVFVDLDIVEAGDLGLHATI